MNWNKVQYNISFFMILTLFPVSGVLYAQENLLWAGTFTFGVVGIFLHRDSIIGVFKEVLHEASQEQNKK